MAATIDQQFVDYIAKTIVGNPDKVQIKRTIDEKGVLLELFVDPEDLGRVIGRGGSTAKSIRTLLRALGVKNDARYNLKIIDTAEESAPAPSETENKEAPEAQPSTEEATDDSGAAEATAVEGEAPTPARDEDRGSDSDESDVEKPEEKSDLFSKHREDLSNLTDLDI